VTNINRFCLLMILLACFVDCKYLWASNTSFEDQNQSIAVLKAETINIVEKCVDEGKPIDLCDLVQKIEALPPVFQGREHIIHVLGKLLVFEGEIHIEEGAPLTGLAPTKVVRNAIIDAFSRFHDKTALPYLQKLCELHGRDKYSRLTETVSALGGNLPIGRVSPTEEGVSITEAERNARRMEINELVTNMSKKDLHDNELDKIIRRIGEIGDSSDARVIIDRIRSDDVHWIIKQNALEALGDLGGSDAYAFLVNELERPMPSGVATDDYSHIEAVLRSEAAIALGKCGDEFVVEFLLQLANDNKQFKRVREASNKAVTQIKQRDQRK